MSNERLARLSYKRSRSRDNSIPRFEWGLEGWEVVRENEALRDGNLSARSSSSARRGSPFYSLSLIALSSHSHFRPTTTRGKEHGLVTSLEGYALCRVTRRHTVPFTSGTTSRPDRVTFSCLSHVYFDSPIIRRFSNLLTRRNDGRVRDGSNTRGRTFERSSSPRSNLSLDRTREKGQEDPRAAHREECSSWRGRFHVVRGEEHAREELGNRPQGREAREGHPYVSLPLLCLP